MRTTERRFVEEATPHQWLMVADNLHEQAVRTRAAFGAAAQVELNSGGLCVGRWDAANRAAFLLAGFALENALKAFLIYEHPAWISNGTLSRQLRSHSLVDLQRASSLVPFKYRLHWVLRAFEAGLESWARYPCALDDKNRTTEAVLTSTIWEGYTTLMHSYGRKLCKLLSSGLWRGPHGFEARWIFDGTYLGAEVRPNAADKMRMQS